VLYIVALPHHHVKEHDEVDGGDVQAFFADGCSHDGVQAALSEGPASDETLATLRGGD